MTRTLVIGTISAALFISPVLHAQTATRSTSIDSTVLRSMERWRLPGVVVVIVKDGETILNRGYGTRVVGEERTVNEETLVHIASHSKAVTATALAMLVDAERLSWDDPVRLHIPEFEVTDAYVTDHVTIRDLVSHRGGLPAAAIGGFQNADFRMDDLLAALRTRPTGAFRDQQLYSQPSMALAGEVVSRVSGVPWERFVREHIFEPLGMLNSYTSTPDLVERFGEPGPDQNVFIPARKRAGELLRGDWSTIGTHRLYAPAGGIITNGSDMAKWIALLLRDGEYDGGRLLSGRALAETRLPLIPLDPALRMFTDPVGALGAGTLGWNAVTYCDLIVYFAAGGWMSSVVAIMPDVGLGVGIFTNAYFSERHGFESLFAVHSLALEAIDFALSREPREWNALYDATLSRAAGEGSSGTQP